ncbi:hypothetical protein FOL47_003101, partial [Perkinsus chesapeaki]
PASMSTAVKAEPNLWDLVGSEVYWKTSQGRNRLKADISNSTNNPDRITRGVFVTLPSTPTAGFLRELRAMLLSWLLIRSRQPDSFRTDLVIATSGRGAEFARELGCTDVGRTNAEGNSSCVIVDYIMLEDRHHPDGDAADPLVSYGTYLNSIMPTAEYEG